MAGAGRVRRAGGPTGGSCLVPLSQKLALAQFSGSSIVLDRTARQARLTVSPLTITTPN